MEQKINSQKTKITNLPDVHSQNFDSNLNKIKEEKYIEVPKANIITKIKKLDEVNDAAAIIELCKVLGSEVFEIKEIKNELEKANVDFQQVLRESAGVGVVSETDGTKKE